MTKNFWNRFATGLAILALSACGGGGGDGGAPAPSAALSFSGTAATGAAMAGATVSLKCATGSGTATTAANGTYTATVSRGVLPCLLQATSADGRTVLHSLAEGTGSSTAGIAANITPLTELVLARLLASADTGSAYEAFSGTTRDRLTAANVASAVAAVQQALAAIDPLIGSTDPLRGSFVAATANNSGDATDKAIDKLMAQLAAAAPDATDVSAQVQALAQVLATAQAGSVTGAASNFLAPPVAGCTALRNVPYRIVDTHGGFARTTSLDWAKGTLSAAWDDGSTEAASLSFGSAHACQFAMGTDTGTVDGYAASSGVVVLRDAGSSNSRAGLGLGFPDQKLAVSDLAGTWNIIEFSNDGVPNGPFTNFQDVLALDSSGKITTDLGCDNTTTSSQTCATNDPEGAPAAIRESTDGGFHFVDASGKPLPGLRLFAFRNASGKTMLVASVADGGLAVGARQAAAALPTEGATTRFWDVQAYQVPGESTLRTTVDTAEITIQSVNTAAQQVTRLRTLSNGTSDGRIDVVNYNQPRAGLRFRPAGSYTLNGAIRNFAGALQLPIEGMGLSFAANPGPAPNGSNKFLSVSVTQ